MSRGLRCCGLPTTPSGHSQICYSDKFLPVRPDQHPAADPSDYGGPYRNHQPPGDRDPAIGQKEYGDLPYLPAYQDPMYPVPSHPGCHPDNLYIRGPFYGGVSETHDQFANRGGIEPRKYHQFHKHYVEPGMKNDLSITYTDYCPPQPMLPEDVMPCLTPPPRPQDLGYVRKPVRPKRDDQTECILRKEPELMYVEPEPVRDFRTEHSDFYVCFQKEKKKNPLLDFQTKEERFQRYLKCTHQNCRQGVPEKSQPPPIRRQKCTSRLTNGTYPNGYMILPHKPT